MKTLTRIKKLQKSRNIVGKQNKFNKATPVTDDDYSEHENITV